MERRLLSEVIVFFASHGRGEKGLDAHHYTTRGCHDQELCVSPHNNQPETVHTK
jgi:hypothetical protein